MQLPQGIAHRLSTFGGALAVGTLVTLLAALVLGSQQIMTKSELRAYDVNFGIRGSQNAPGIVLVELDSPSLSDLNNSKYPIPRNYFAQVVNYLHRAGARAIGLDFVFLGHQSTRDDQALAQAMRRARNVAISAYFEGGEVGNGTLLGPPGSLRRAAAGVGIANVNQDQEDGVTRSFDLFPSVPGTTTLAGVRQSQGPSLSLLVASIARGKSVAELARGLPQTNVLINYPGKQLVGDPSQCAFTCVRFEDLISGAEPARTFRNKIALVVPYALITKDTIQTPYGAEYGGAVQASALYTVLNRNPIRGAGDNLNRLIAVLVGLAATYAAARFGLVRSAGATVLLGVGYFLLTLVLFSQFQIWINLVTPETALVLVFASVMGFRFATEERRRRKTTKIFGEHLKPEIVDILVNAPNADTALAGARRPISVLFVDIRGFTAMSERMDPEKVVSLLDVYLEDLTASVYRFDGTVDKYVGDELMAIWNAPLLQEDHAMRAVQCALDMVASADRINQQLLAAELPRISFGIGVNSGDAIVGRMGSSRHKQYDVIGDTVNTAARLCSAAGRSEIIIGEETWNLVGDRLEVEETEPLPLKGKSAAFRTFVVLGLKPEAEPAPATAPAPA